MKVYVDLHDAHYTNGEAAGVYARVVIEHSPREGYDHEKLRALENELTEILQDGLNDALGKAERKTT